MPLDSRGVHDRDWLGGKASDAFFEQAPRYPEIAAALVALRPRRLLDVGCGSGYLARLVRASVPGLVVDGVDISPVALERARPHLRQVWEVDLDKGGLPMEAGQYDAVACVEVLEHLYDPQSALREIARVLAPGGTALVTVPNLAYWRYRLALLRGGVPPPAADPRHLHQFDRHLLFRALEEAGLTPIRLTGHGVRLRGLARRWPGLWSDILIATAVKELRG